MNSRSDASGLGRRGDGLLPVDRPGRRQPARADARLHGSREALAATRGQRPGHLLQPQQAAPVDEGRDSAATCWSWCRSRRDCDDDTLLVLADPHGPTCHLQRASCFPDAPGDVPRRTRCAGRATRARASRRQLHDRLFEAGVRRIAQKVGEEGVETALAAVVQDDAALLGEAADLVYPPAGAAARARAWRWRELRSRRCRSRAAARPDSSAQAALIECPARNRGRRPWPRKALRSAMASAASMSSIAPGAMVCTPTLAEIRISWPCVLHGLSTRCPAQAFGDLDRLVQVVAGQADHELLAAEARQQRIVRAAPCRSVRGEAQAVVADQVAVGGR